jgi:hypothetical protein
MSSLTQSAFLSTCGRYAHSLSICLVHSFQYRLSDLYLPEHRTPVRTRKIIQNGLFCALRQKCIILPDLPNSELCPVLQENLHFMWTWHGIRPFSPIPTIFTCYMKIVVIVRIACSVLLCWVPTRLSHP